jgi:hypothetical protein
MNCDICGSLKNVVEDECFINNEIRGHVCSNCKIIINISEENVDYLNDIKIYLLKYQNSVNNKWELKFGYMKEFNKKL